MYQAIIIFHVLLGLAIIGLVLMQHGKGADAGAAFGSGASGTLFGARGAASFLSRTTAMIATLFFITSLTLAVLAGHRETVQDIMDKLPPSQQVTPDLPEVPQVQSGSSQSETAAVEIPGPDTAAPAPQTSALTSDATPTANDIPVMPQKENSEEGRTIEPIAAPQ